MTLAAMGIEWIRPAGSDLVRDAVDDAFVGMIDRDAAEHSATARVLNLLAPLALLARSGRHRRTLLCLAR